MELSLLEDSSIQKRGLKSSEVLLVTTPDFLERTTIPLESLGAQEDLGSVLFKICHGRFRADSGSERAEGSSSEGLFSCDVCADTFPDESALQEHQKKHLGGKQLVYEYCAEVFASMYRHISTHAVVEKPHECKSCSKTFSSSAQLSQHRRTHTERRHACESCPKSYVARCDLMSHVRQRHTGERPFSCDLCTKSFATRKVLVEHRRTHTGERPFPCGVCSKTFPTKSKLMQHARTHGDKALECTPCLQTTECKSSLPVESSRQRLPRTSEKPFQCEQCARSFITHEDLVGHVDRIHTGEKRFQCKQCPKSFTTNSHLVRHTMIHTGERPFRCAQCPNAFITRSDLLRHTRTHTGEKPFMCEVCAKSFSTSYNLLLHARTHAGVKPYACRLCPAAYYTRGDLAKHKKLHD